MEKWVVAAKRADFNAWAERFGISPVLARILRNRDITEEAELEMFLRGTMEDCHDPLLLMDCDKAVAEIRSAIEEHRNIRVIGDYDVDGICSTHILVTCLKKLGADVSAAIPHRVLDGYGLNESLIRSAHEDGVELIITCDNGISAREQIELANELGMRVIVTDHHEVPYEETEQGRVSLLPSAVAVVDPKRSDDIYPFKGICGAVVAYKLMQAVDSSLGDGRLEDTLYVLLQYAAMATVCDVMELRDENRIIVKEGIRRLRQSPDRGIKALCQANALELDRISAFSFGFVLGPCINATGRLDTATRALELLDSDSDTSAGLIAAELKAMNDSRKEMTLDGVEAANRYIEERGIGDDKVIIVFLPDVHESLAGIIAGRIREQYGRPVIILTEGEEGVKGSGRSIEAFNMFEELVKVREYLTKFGGHKLAAGLSTKREWIEPLRLALNDNCSLTDEDFIPKIVIDVPLPIRCANIELGQELELLEPMGVANPRPLFAEKELTFVKGAPLGRNGNMAKFNVVSTDGTRATMFLFNDLDRFAEYLNEKYGAESFDNLMKGQGSFTLAVIYQLGINSFRGNVEVQLVIKNYQ